MIKYSLSLLLHPEPYFKMHKDINVFEYCIWDYIAASDIIVPPQK